MPRANKTRQSSGPIRLESLHPLIIDMIFRNGLSRTKTQRSPFALFSRSSGKAINGIFPIWGIGFSVCLMKMHQSALMILRATHQPAARGNGSLVEVELLHFRRCFRPENLQAECDLVSLGEVESVSRPHGILLNGPWSTKKGFRPSPVLSSNRKPKFGNSSSTGCQALRILRRR